MLVVTTFNVEKLKEEIIGQWWSVTITLSNQKEYHLLERDGELEINVSNQLEVKPKASNSIHLNYERY